MLYYKLKDACSVLAFRLFGKMIFKSFGRNTHIVRPLRIVGGRYTVIGNNVTLQVGAYLATITDVKPSPLLQIDSGCMLGHHMHIICSSKIHIGEKVLMADKVYISDNLHSYKNIEIPVMDQPLVQLKDVEIGSGTWVGENVCIIGASIGKNCVIGANSVVTKDIPDYTVAVGAPAKPIKRYCLETQQWKRTDADNRFIE